MKARTRTSNLTIEQLALVDMFLELFREEYSYLSVELKNEQVYEFLERDYIKDRKISSQLDLFKDYLLANQYCEVQE